MLLELGSGDRPYQDGREWTHNDIRPLDDIELLGDILPVLKNLEDESVKEVMARHILEHFPKNPQYKDSNIDQVLTEILRVLVKNGKLHIEVPNIIGQFEAFQRGEFDEDQLAYYLYGEEDYYYNFHYNGFGPNSLNKKLTEIGFTNVNIQDIGLVLVCTCFKGES